MNANRHEIVEECLELLRLGTSLEECLTRYPDDAEELEPILRTAVSALAALEPIARLATGTITVRLYKGEVYFETAEDTRKAMPHSLYTDDSSMEATGSYDHADAEGFLRIQGLPGRVQGRVTPREY